MITKTPARGAHSPWGMIQDATPYGPDVVSVSTASHGGFWVGPESLEAIPEEFRTTPYSPGCWFEEDCDWSIPYAFLGLDQFEADPTRGAEVRKYARETLERYHPAAYAALLKRGL